VGEARQIVPSATRKESTAGWTQRIVEARDGRASEKTFRTNSRGDGKSHDVREWHSVPKRRENFKLFLTNID
jgi:hypothetical protein